MKILLFQVYLIIRRYIITFILGIVAILILLYTRNENVRLNNIGKSASVSNSSYPSTPDGASSSEKAEIVPIETPTPTPEMELCTFAKECNIKPVMLLKGECKKGTCCQIGEKWELTLTDECSSKQEEYNKKYKALIDNKIGQLKKSNIFNYPTSSLPTRAPLILQITPFDFSSVPTPATTQTDNGMSESQRKADYQACRSKVSSNYSKNMSSCAARGVVDSFGVGGCSQYESELSNGYRYCNSTYNLCMGADDCAKYGP